MALLHWFRVARARWHGLVRRDAITDEIREELEFHVEARTREHEGRGVGRAEARRVTLARFGHPDVMRDRGYDVRGGGLMESVWQDARYSLRLLVKQRGFSLVALLTLALGIGVTTALFSVIDATMIRPLPYPHPEQIVDVTVRTPQRDGRAYNLAPSFDDLRTLAAAHAVVTTAVTWRQIFQAPVTDEPAPERLQGFQVTAGFLDLYGVTPLLGRAIDESDVQDGAPNVLILGFDYWQRRFGGSADAIGKTLALDDGPSTIIGVLPQSFYHATSIVRPLRMSPRAASMRGSGATTYVRLRAGVSVDEAEHALTAIVAGQPGATPGSSVVVKSVLGDAIQENQHTANTLAAAVALILLIACVNVGGLLLARGASRAPELALRAAIGAGRGRLVRQLLTEALVLAVAGGTLGVVAAWWSLGALTTNVPMSFSTNAPPAMNAPVLAFSFALSTAVGLLFGLVPAWRLSRVSLSGALAGGARRSGSSLSRRGGQLLIGVEVALSVILVVGAGLMIRSFHGLLAVDLGFEPDRYVTFETTPVDTRGATALTYYPALLERIRALPGVAAAGAVDTLPLWSSSYTGVTPEGGQEVSANVSQFLPGYFEAVGFRLRAGRFPTDQDWQTHRAGAVVNESGARRLFADRSPLGRTVTIGTVDQPLEVVGVVADLKRGGPASRMDDRPQVYAPFTPDLGSAIRGLTVIVRPSSGSAIPAAELRQIAPAIGPRVLVGKIRLGSDWLDDNVRTPRQRTVLLVLLGGLGLALALVGVFGMTSYAVARRTSEIGVRMAFGARPAQVVGAMMADAALPIALGIAAGLGGAAFATKLIASFLFATTPRDPLTFAIVAAALAAAGGLAAWLPARRAARVDPVIALRAE